MLVDGSGYIFRAFFALPPLTDPKGTPVGAVFGFCNMLFRLAQDMPGDQLVVVFDKGSQSFRNAMYDAYKANRMEPPDDLVPQFPLVREAAHAFDLPVIELEGYEADDVIATYARHAREQDREVIIVSSDKDLMQLVGGAIQMYDPMKQKAIDRDEVIARFGVGPERVGDVLALAGDTSDNVPGVPGIGVKTAAQLLTEFGSLEDLLAGAATIKQPKRRQNLLDHAEQARLSRRLVALCDTAPVPATLDQLDGAIDYGRLLAFARQHNFKSLVQRLEPLAASAGGRAGRGRGAAAERGIRHDRRSCRPRRMDRACDREGHPRALPADQLGQHHAGGGHRASRSRSTRARPPTCRSGTRTTSAPAPPASCLARRCWRACGRCSRTRRS